MPEAPISVGEVMRRLDRFESSIGGQLQELKQQFDRFEDRYVARDVYSTSQASVDKRLTSAERGISAINRLLLGTLATFVIGIVTAVVKGFPH